MNIKAKDVYIRTIAMNTFRKRVPQIWVRLSTRLSIGAHWKVTSRSWLYLSHNDVERRSHQNY